MTVTTFDGAPAETKAFHVDWDLEAAQKQGFDWFMRKEIFEQPHAVADTLLGRLNDRGELVLDEVRISPEELRRIRQDRDRRLRHQLRGPGREVRHRALTRARWSSPPSSATATRSSTR